jgi:hypothetical protein
MNLTWLWIVIGLSIFAAIGTVLLGLGLVGLIVALAVA